MLMPLMKKVMSSFNLLIANLLQKLIRGSLKYSITYQEGDDPYPV